MSWRIAYREQVKGYRLYSTILDDWLTDWGTKEDIIRYIAEEYLIEHKKRIIELYLRFPHNWPSKESMRYIQEDTGRDRYGAWLHTLATTSPEAYSEVIDQKYQEVMKELEIP